MDLLTDEMKKSKIRTSRQPMETSNMATGLPVRATVLRAILVAVAALTGVPSMSSDTRIDDSIRSGADDIGSGVCGSPHRRITGNPDRFSFAVPVAPIDDSVQEASTPHDRTPASAEHDVTAQHSHSARNSYGVGSYASSSLGANASVSC